MQLNSGILERRRHNLPAALSHFQLAAAIEPGYCEPDYWIGITLVNMGEGRRGSLHLPDAAPRGPDSLLLQM